MTVPALEARRLVKRFGGITATNDVSLAIEKDELHALIGPNGAGKTSLISLLAGELAPDAGSILYHGESVTHLKVHQRCRTGIARSFQITSLCNEFTVIDNVIATILARDGWGRAFWRDARSDAARLAGAHQIVERVGLAGQGEAIVASLSHGEQRQLEVGLALATGADVLLLDEPLAGMGIAEASAMVALLQKLKTGLTIVLIEHDMDAVFSLADRISVLSYGSVIATGTPTEIQQDSNVRAAYLGEGAA